MVDFIRALASLGSPKGNPIRQGYRAGDLLPYWQDGNPQWREWDDRAAIDEGFKVSPWVSTCCRRRYQAQASVPWMGYELGGDIWEPRPDSPLTDLLERPNFRMSRGELFTYRSLHMDLGGNALWSKVFVGKILAELWPMVVYPIRPIPSRANFIDAYRYMDGGINVDIPAGQVVHFIYPNPGNLYWGIGRLQAVAKTVDTESEARDWNKAALKNRAVADGVFTLAQNITQEQWEEARQQIAEQQQGVANARMPWVLGSGAQWNQMGLSPIDMDFIAGLKMALQEIAAAFDVPLPMLGVMEHATLANFDTSRRVFWEEGIIPDLDAAEMVINRDITPHFGPTARPKHVKEFREWVKSGLPDRALAKLTAPVGHKRALWAAYDTSRVMALRADLGTKVDTMRKLMDAGVPARLAAQIADVDLGPNLGPWADESFIANTLIPLSRALAGGPPAPGSTKTSDLSRALQTLESSDDVVRSRLQRGFSH